MNQKKYSEHWKISDSDAVNDVLQLKWCNHVSTALDLCCEPEIRMGMDMPHCSDNLSLSHVFSFRFSYEVRAHTHIASYSSTMHFASRKCLSLLFPRLTSCVPSLRSQIPRLILREMGVWNTNCQSVLGGNILDSPERVLIFISLPMAHTYIGLDLTRDRHRIWFQR